jgi:hypothetical protein
MSAASSDATVKFLSHLNLCKLSEQAFTKEQNWRGSNEDRNADWVALLVYQRRQGNRQGLSFLLSCLEGREHPGILPWHTLRSLRFEEGAE